MDQSLDASEILNVRGIAGSDIPDAGRDTCFPHMSGGI